MIKKKKNAGNLHEKVLTKAEEQIMRAVWEKDASFLKDIMDLLPAPRPHSNTVATILKILIEKGFVTTNLVGRNHLYSALLSKEEYTKRSFSSVVSNYFNGSFKNAVSFLVDKQQISVDELELLLKELKKK